MFYYSRQIAMRVASQMPPPLTWHISQNIINCLSPIVIAYVLNQPLGHWLLTNALNSMISLSLKLKRIVKFLPSFENLMEDEANLAKELALLASNIRKEVCGVLYSFLSFLKKYEENKAHNMVYLMLDLSF